MQPRNQSEHDEDEEPAGDVDAEQQFGQRQERLQAVLADGECHGAEGSQGRQFHNQRNDFEGQVGERIGRFQDRLSQVVSGQGHAKKDRHQQNLQDFSVGKGADHGVGNDVQHEILRGELLPAGGVLLHGRGIQGGGGGVDPGAGLDHLDHDESHQQRDCGHHLEVDQGLEPDPAQLAHVPDSRDAGHHGQEDDGGDHHADELDEAVAERFHHRADGGV